MTDEWWRGAVFYQIYPRSFKDSNGDGIGDLKGITEKLDYVASLGVDAIWLSPYFLSPMIDFGYDISDYRAVDPMFGTLDDFDAMTEKAHSLGLKIVIDQVMNHTSDQHAWFQESRESRDNPKADWYVWADAKADGSPPNNWQAIFGGASWTFEVRRGQYYLHNFLAEQPDLNLHNPEVRKAILADAAFWLDHGVDGFRLDASRHFFHDPALTDNPPHPDPSNSVFNARFPTPYSMQDHIHDIDIPRTLEFLSELRELLNSHDGAMSVGEIGGQGDGLELTAAYTTGNARLHTAYNFSLLGCEKLEARYIRHVFEKFKSFGGGWPSWAFSNHDFIRAASRFHPEGGFNHDPRLSKMLVALLCSLRGTLFLYQGDELGLPDAPILPEQIQDPLGKRLFPLWQGRDGCRTPMPWDSSQHHAGFSDSEKEPWLPIPDEHLPLSVARQEEDENSTLAFTRAFLKWRKQYPQLISGDIRFIDTDDDELLYFVRENDGEAVHCLFNLSDQEKSYELDAKAEPLDMTFFCDFPLKPYGFFFAKS